MSAASELLCDLAALGIEVVPHGGNLRLRPQSVVAPALLARVKANKGDLLALLSAIPNVGETPTKPENSEGFADSNAEERRQLDGEGLEVAPLDNAVSIEDCSAIPPGHCIPDRTHDPSPEAIERFWESVRDADKAYLLSPIKTEPCPWCGGRLHHNPLCDELRASWELTLPFGKHRGKRISEVPADYLRWLLENGSSIDSDLRQTIEHSLGKKR